MKPVRIVADRGYAGRPLWERMHARGIDFIVPPKHHAVYWYHDFRKLRRYRHRWIVERSISWLLSFRRIATRHEHRLDLYRAFVYLGCLWIALRRL